MNLHYDYFLILIITMISLLSLSTDKWMLFKLDDAICLMDGTFFLFIIIKWVIFGVVCRWCTTCVFGIHVIWKTTNVKCAWDLDGGGGAGDGKGTPVSIGNNRTRRGRHEGRQRCSPWDVGCSISLIHPNTATHSSLQHNRRAFD